MNSPLAVATITGRRRVGKSRLVAEHARRVKRTLIKIEGRDISEGGNAAQLAAFAMDLSAAAGIPVLGLDNWNTAFRTLGTLAKGQQWIILLDEITWLAHHGEECLAELKVFIDRDVNGSGNQLVIYSGELVEGVKDSICFDREICVDELLSTPSSS